MLIVIVSSLVLGLEFLSIFLNHKLVNRKTLILLLEKYFKIFNDMIIDIAGKKPLESSRIFQSGRNNGIKIWVFDATRGISR